MNRHRRRSSGPPRPHRADLRKQHGRAGGQLRRWGPGDPEPRLEEVRRLRGTGPAALWWRSRWTRVRTHRSRPLFPRGPRSWDSDYCWWNTDKSKYWAVVAQYGPLVDADAAAAFYRSYDRRRRARRRR